MDFCTKCVKQVCDKSTTNRKPENKSTTSCTTISESCNLLYNLLYSKSTTNRTNGVCVYKSAIQLICIGPYVVKTQESLAGPLFWSSPSKYIPKWKSSDLRYPSPAFANRYTNVYAKRRKNNSTALSSRLGGLLTSPLGDLRMCKGRIDASGLCGKPVGLHLTGITWCQMKAITCNLPVGTHVMLNTNQANT